MVSTIKINHLYYYFQKRERGYVVITAFRWFLPLRLTTCTITFRQPFITTVSGFKNFLTLGSCQYSITPFLYYIKPPKFWMLSILEKNLAKNFTALNKIKILKLWICKSTLCSSKLHLWNRIVQNNLLWVVSHLS